MKLNTKNLAAEVSIILNDASDIDDVAHALFNSVVGKTLQLSKILTKEEFEKAQQLYTEQELNTLQNLIDVFYNSVTV